MRHKLKLGQMAPDFNTRDVFHKSVKLGDYKSKFLLLVFLRYSGCPWCNLALHRLTMEHPLLQQYNCEVVAFIQSTEPTIIKNIYDRHARRPEFPIIADKDRKIYDRYGISTSVKAAINSVLKIPYWAHAVKEHGFKQKEIDGNLFLAPAMFLISGRTGKLLMATYSSSFYEHETFTRIYELLGFTD